MIKNFIFFILAMLLFLGCSGKDEARQLTEKSREILMYSKKAKFTQNGENTSFVLFYLNPLLENEEDNDVFALLVTPQMPELGEFELVAEGRGAAISPMPQELLKYLPSAEYSSFYLLNFPFKDDSVITLRLCFHGECENLDIQKYSKSLYYRSEDVDVSY